MDAHRIKGSGWRRLSWWNGHLSVFCQSKLESQIPVICQSKTEKRQQKEQNRILEHVLCFLQQNLKSMSAAELCTSFFIPVLMKTLGFCLYTEQSLYLVHVISLQNLKLFIIFPLSLKYQHEKKLISHNSSIPFKWCTISTWCIKYPLKDEE